MNVTASTAVRVAILIVLVAAASRAMLVSWADLVYRQGTPASVQKAVQILPSDATYHYTNALLLEENEPASPQIEREFAAAVSDNPRYSDALLAWSVEKELKGDKSGAEQLLLRAHSIDHLVRPSWALANFYYRQGDVREFLTYAHEALQMIGISRLSEGRFNPSPIYQLFWQSGASPADILKYGIPDVPVIRDSYLTFLLATGRAPYAPAAAARILPYVNKDDLYFLRPYMDYLIVSDQMELAVRTWKRFFERGVVPYAGPDPATGKLLTNGDLAGAPIDFGFDWRRTPQESVPFEYSRIEHAYRFTFDGTEPEQFVLLTQTIPVEPKYSYRFSARFDSDFDPEAGGLRWSFRDHKSGASLSAQAALTQDGDNKALQMDVSSPPGGNSIDLVLGYHRPPATAPIHGYYQLLHADFRRR